MDWPPWPGIVPSTAGDPCSESQVGVQLTDAGDVVADADKRTDASEIIPHTPFIADAVFVHKGIDHHFQAVNHEVLSKIHYQRIHHIRSKVYYKFSRVKCPGG